WPYPPIYSYSGGGIYCENASPLIRNCIIRDNKAPNYSGGIGYGGGLYCLDASPVLRNNRFENNYAGNDGGAVYLEGNSSPLFENNAIVKNRKDEGYGGGVYICHDAGAIFRHCTFTLNLSIGIWVEGGGSATLLDCIVWDNQNGSFNNGAPVTADYCDIAGGWPGTGNIDADPLFVDAPSGDVRLQQDPCQPGVSNPCVDAGDPGTPPIIGTTRTDGVLDSGVADMGFHYRYALLVPTGFASIQSAIDAAVEGDTILVLPGTYYENILLSGKRILLESSDGAEATVIDGNRAGSVVTLTDCVDAMTVLRGFTLRNGWGAGEPTLSGGGITCIHSAPKIEYNVIEQNEAAYGGGGICCIDSAPVIEHNVFQENESGYAGGGLYCRNIVNAPENAAQIAHNEFRANRAEMYGGGIFCRECDPEIRQNSIELNECLDPGGMGGGIACWESAPTIFDNDILTNEALFFGGGISLWFADALLDRNRIHGNQAGDTGGGVACLHSMPVLTNLSIYENAAGVSGGGLSCTADSQVVLTHNTFYANQAAVSGGALFSQNISTRVCNTIVWGNTAPLGSQLQGTGFDVTYCNVQGGFPGAGNIDQDPRMIDPAGGDFHIALDSPCLDQGDALAPHLPEIDFEGDRRLAYLAPDMGVDEYVLGGRTLLVPSEYLSIQDAVEQTVTGDTILVGPGTYMDNLLILSKDIIIRSTHGAPATVIDGSPGAGWMATVNFRSNITSNCVIEGFTITNGDHDPWNGGGIHCYDHASPTIRNNIICNNKAYSGGGIGTQDGSSPTIMNNLIYGNSTTYYGGDGGGIYQCDLGVISGNIIYDNSTDRSGGGIYAADSLSLANNVIFGNSASDYGGGICQEYSGGTVVNCTVFENHAVKGGGGLFVACTAPVTVVNSILWSNEAVSGKEIFIVGSQMTPSVLDISFTDVEGGMASVYVGPYSTLKVGAGMIDADPLLADAGRGDAHLLYGSPCRNAGNNSAAGLPA
ncbi:MAG: right-handed parallel beta-helix repeat-containing protein, partial [Planctomycetota bacterium]